MSCWIERNGVWERDYCRHRMAVAEVDGSWWWSVHNLATVYGDRAETRWKAQRAAMSAAYSLRRKELKGEK